MTQESDKAKKIAVGAVVGAAAGFVAGVLLAPKSGKETREDLKNGSKKVVKEADKQLKGLHDDLSKIVDKVESRASDMTEAAKKEAADAVAKAKKSRDQVATVMTAVRSGNSTDEDLDIAIKNASSAIDSLKKYLKK
jgi:gas vesicle protein